MSKGAYIGVNGVARKMKGGYVGVDGVARKMKKAYIGDANGIARLWWEPEPAYLTFSSPDTFSIKATTPVWNGTIEYSIDAKTWYTWSGNEIVSLNIYFRGTGNTQISNGTAWTLTGSDIACTGNIETLLDYATVEADGHPTMANYCYTGLFSGCTALTTAPSLPATTLTNYCYQNMFAGCTALTTAPSLPATTLGDGCYAGMFGFCYALTTVPALPATRLPANCYQAMFVNSTNIKLSATKTDEYAHEYRIPTSGTGGDTSTYVSTYQMFTDTGGTFTGTPTINTTYYLHKDCSIV